VRDYGATYGFEYRIALCWCATLVSVMYVNQHEACFSHKHEAMGSHCLPGQLFIASAMPKGKSKKPAIITDDNELAPFGFKARQDKLWNSLAQLAFGGLSAAVLGHVDILGL
jgi:hypothetical protein